MKSNVTLLKAAVFALCLLGYGLAEAGTAATPKVLAEHGTIKSIDPKHHSLVLWDAKDKSEHKFQWNEQTKFTEGGKAVSATELNAGEHALISYESAKGVAMIKSISLTPAKTEKQPQSHSSHTGKSK